MRIRPEFLLILMLASCEQARRYPAGEITTPKTPTPHLKKTPPPPAHWSWMPVGDVLRDLPIVFVPESAPAWKSLPTFWNNFPAPAAGQRTVHLGLPPLEAASAMVLADEMQSIRIRVPRGLPDPNPLFPASNPPTYGKWRIGNKIFFAQVLRSGDEVYACATCHQPEPGFTEPRPRTQNGLFNTPSLINVVYNRRQFWDGRAATLEEAVVRSLDDEQPLTDDLERDRPEITHRWGGLVKALAADQGIRGEFKAVFGIEQPTQDAIVRALATYLRTILSGDSLFDRAQAEQHRLKAGTLNHDHFLAVLDDDVLKNLDDGKLGKADAARKLVTGFRLFHGKANCRPCHHGPRFTDDDFHNIGLDPIGGLRTLDKAGGRIKTIPLGQKEKRFVDAYKTPSLRALPRTARYFHDGKKTTLRDVVQFYNQGIQFTPFLAAPLIAGDREQSLGLSDDEIDALVLFLQSLDGTRVDSIVATPIK